MSKHQVPYSFHQLIKCLVLMPPLTPACQQQAHRSMSSLSDLVFLKAMAVSVFPGPMHIVQLLAQSQSQLLTVGNANFLSTRVDRSSSIYSSFPGNWGTSDSGQKGEKKHLACFHLQGKRKITDRQSIAQAEGHRPSTLGSQADTEIEAERREVQLQEMSWTVTWKGSKSGLCFSLFHIFLTPKSINYPLHGRSPRFLVNSNSGLIPMCFCHCHQLSSLELRALDTRSTWSAQAWRQQQGKVDHIMDFGVGQTWVPCLNK